MVDIQLLLIRYSVEAFASAIIEQVTSNTRGICFRPFNPFAAQVAAHIGRMCRSVPLYAAEIQAGQSLPDGVLPFDAGTAADIYVLCDSDAAELSARLLDYLDLEQGTLIAPITSHFYRERPLFMISVPKSGTHLMYEFLQTLGYKQGLECPDFPDPGTYYFLQAGHSHTTAKGFLGRSPREYPAFMRSPTVFIYRNPLDVLISEANYFARDGQVISAGYFNSLSFEDRLLKLVDNPWLYGSIRERVGNYAGWLEMLNVIPISYEQIVGPQGGSDLTTQLRLIWSLQLKLHIPGAPQQFAARVYNPNSPTFHTGKVHSYRERLTSEARAKFLELPQDFMQAYGYDGPDAENPVVVPRHAERFRHRPVTVSAIDYDAEQVAVGTGLLAHNIYRYAGRLYAVPWSMGFVDLKQATPEQLAQIPQERLMGNLKQRVVQSLIRGDKQPSADTGQDRETTHAVIAESPASALQRAAAEQTKFPLALSVNVSGESALNRIKTLDRKVKSLLDAGHYAECAPLLQQWAALQPDDAAVRNLLGQVLMQAGQFEAAQSVLLEAVALAPQRAAIHNNLAVLHWQQGDVQQAVERMRQARQLAPQDREITANCEVLRQSLAGWATSLAEAGADLTQVPPAGDLSGCAV